MLVGNELGFTFELVDGGADLFGGAMVGKAGVGSGAGLNIEVGAVADWAMVFGFGAFAGGENFEVVEDAVGGGGCHRIALVVHSAR
jgi:hypothetical protein